MSTVRPPKHVQRHRARSSSRRKISAALALVLASSGMTTLQVADAAATTSAPTIYNANQLVNDTFARTVDNGFGTATVGGAYTQRGTATAVRVTPGAGSLAVPSGQTVEELLNTSAADVGARLTFVVPTISNSSTFKVYQGLELRRQSASSYYLPRVVIGAAGAAYVQILRVTGPGTSYTVLSAVPVGTFTSGQSITLQAKALGNVISVRAWAAGAATPSWTSATDTSAKAIAGPGGFGSLTYVGSSSAAITLRFSGLTETAYTVDQPPVARITSTSAGDTAHFDGSGSSDPDGSIASYVWDFGDGSTGAGVSASHAYAKPGSYTATLTVTDNSGSTDAASATVFVDVAPLAKVTASINTLTANFDGSGSSDPDGSIASYVWDFGDGSTGTGVSATHTYAKPGNYTATLTVTDNSGVHADASTTVIANLPPVASMTSAIHGASVTLDGSTSSDPDGTITSYLWNFGDGATATTTAPTTTHTYAASGTYSVTMTVTDSNQLTAVTSSQITVVLNVPPTAVLSANDVGMVSYLDASASSDSDATITSYSWDFGDGTTATTTAPTTRHVYSVAGNYTVTVTVTDDADASSTATIAVTADPIAVPASAGTIMAGYVATMIGADPLTKTTGSGLGTASSGGAWSTPTPQPGTSVFTTATSGAVEAIAPTAGMDYSLPATSAADVQAQQTMVFTDVPSTGTYDQWAGVELRGQSNGSKYRVQLHVSTGGVASLSVAYVAGSTVTAVGPTFTLPFTVVAGQPVTVQGAITGSTISARAWINGQAVPAWQTSFTDSSIAAAGSVGTWLSTGGGSPTTIVLVSNFAAYSLSSIASLTPFTGTKTEPGGGVDYGAGGVVLTAAQPNPNNTGVPAGTKLTVVTGNLHITTAGATYSGYDFQGFVYIEAPNVTIKNSLFEGGPTANTSLGLLNDYSSAGTNFLVEDSEFAPMMPNVYEDGIQGANYTALRVNIHGTVDGAKMDNSNDTIEDSYIHDLVVYAHDPYQHNTPSHSDGVQLFGGSNLHINNNTILGGGNSATQITQSVGPVTLSIDSNWIGGGACSVNLQDAPLPTMTGVTVSNNLFYKTSQYSCPIIQYPGVKFTNINNTFADGSGTVNVVTRTS